MTEKNLLKAEKGIFQIEFHYLPFFKLYQSTIQKTGLNS